MVNIERLVTELIKMKVELQDLNDQTPDLVAEIKKQKPQKSIPLSIIEAQVYWEHMNKIIEHTQKIKTLEQKIDDKLNALKLPLSLIKHDIEFVYMGNSTRGTISSKWILSYDEAEGRATCSRV